MKKHYLIDKIEESPVIAAVKDYDGLEKSLTCECNVVFVLFGDIMTIKDIVAKIKNAGKATIVHADLITGLSSKEVSVDFLKEQVAVDGIISTKQNIVKHASELGLFTIMRFFVIDSLALLNIKKQVDGAHPDCIEILPGVMPKIIKRVCDEERYPIIAGGLISDKEDILSALNAGAIAVSSTAPDVWFL